MSMLTTLAGVDERPFRWTQRGTLIGCAVLEYLKFSVLMQSQSPRELAAWTPRRAALVTGAPKCHKFKTARGEQSNSNHPTNNIQHHPAPTTMITNLLGFALLFLCAATLGATQRSASSACPCVSINAADMTVTVTISTGCTPGVSHVDIPTIYTCDGEAVTLTAPVGDCT
jgi:hypothetical protein